MIEEIIVLLTPYGVGFSAGAISGFVQYLTKLKDENKDSKIDEKDFRFVKLGKTVIVASISGAWLQGTGLELDPLMIGFLSAGSEKVVGIIAKFIAKFFKKNELQDFIF